MLTVEWHQSDCCMSLVTSNAEACWDLLHHNTRALVLSHRGWSETAASLPRLWSETQHWKPVTTSLEVFNGIRLFPVFGDRPGSRGFWERFSSLLDKDGVLLLIVVQAEAMAGAEGDQFPLGVQVESGDHSWRLALDQGEGLEARWKQDGLL